jgi:hypothetical protein
MYTTQHGRVGEQLKLGDRRYCDVVVFEMIKMMLNSNIYTVPGSDYKLCSLNGKFVFDSELFEKVLLGLLHMQQSWLFIATIYWLGTFMS